MCQGPAAVGDLSGIFAVLFLPSSTRRLSEGRSPDAEIPRGHLSAGREAISRNAADADAATAAREGQNSFAARDACWLSSIRLNF